MLKPTFKLEKQLRASGTFLIAGTDEAGSGAWAGPVFAGAVSFGQKLPRIPNLLRDSKLLSSLQREKIFLWVQEHVESWAAGQASALEIDTLNIRQAGLLAMRRAIEGLKESPQIVLSDGFPLPKDAPWPSRGIIRGDRLIASISAASIVAKVSRDHFMQRLDQEYPGYGLAVHKGYGTRSHQTALQRLGPSPIHRISYAPIAALLAEGKR
ncbi:ribonuclease HII [Patescibacteria group bacterium]|nr:ribonuclease HII [Patescibacteria group bacterium]